MEKNLNNYEMLKEIAQEELQFDSEEKLDAYVSMFVLCIVAQL